MFQEILHTLSKNKARTFLTSFGVFWGIFMLMIMLGSGNGLRNGVESGFENSATNCFFVWAQNTTKAYGGFQPGREISYSIDDVASIKNGIPEIGVLSPRLRYPNFWTKMPLLNGMKSTDCFLIGDFPQLEEIIPSTFAHGRFINNIDIKQKRKVAVIGARIAELLFANGENPLSKYIFINGVYFQVIGVHALYQKEEWRNEMVSIPFTALQQCFNTGDKVGWFACTSKPSVPASVPEEKMITLLKKKYSIAPDDPQAIGHYNREEEYLKMVGLFNWINIITWVVGFFTLLAGVIGVSNIMLIIIKERTRELGIRRALGATPAKIITQIMQESMVLTIVPGYAGLAAGVAFVELIGILLLKFGGDNQMFKNPEVDLSVAIWALVILAITGTLAGILPSLRAVSIKPVDAIRDE